nr:MAG TPA: bacitracin resistance protein [Caudoviricetes sp.]
MCGVLHPTAGTVRLLSLMRRRSDSDLCFLPVSSTMHLFGVCVY